MQVFIIGSPLDTAKCLDSKRLNKQIIECDQILRALSCDGAWRYHPCTLQYRPYQTWLWLYRNCLSCYRAGDLYSASDYNSLAEMRKPLFHTEEFLNQMKRRLYTKDQEYYKQWADLGESQENWYFVDGEWRKYVNGKRIE